MAIIFRSLFIRSLTFLKNQASLVAPEAPQLLSDDCWSKFCLYVYFNNCFNCLPWFEFMFLLIWFPWFYVFIKNIIFFIFEKAVKIKTRLFFWKIFLTSNCIVLVLYINIDLHSFISSWLSNFVCWKILEGWKGIKFSFMSIGRVAFFSNSMVSKYNFLNVRMSELFY